MLNLYKFTPFISFFGFCIYSWSPLSLVSKQKWSFSTPLNGNRGRVKAELLCFVAVFYFDWLQLTKELPHYWRIHSWKQGFFPELFLARSSHPGFDVRGRALWVDGVQRYSHSPLVIRHHCLAWPLSEGLRVTSYIVRMERVEGELLPPLSWLFPLGFFSSVWLPK